MRVEPGEPQARQLESPPHRLSGVPTCQREAELLVLVRGSDVLIRVCLNPDGDPDQDTLCHTVAVCDVGQSDHLFIRVNDDPADASLDGSGQLCGRLVVAVHGDPAGRKATADRRRQLAARTDIKPEAVLGKPAYDLLTQERLARIGDVRSDTAEGMKEVACPPTEVRLVENVCRCAVLRGEVENINAGGCEDAACPVPIGVL